MTCLPQSLGRVPNRQKSFGSAGLLLCKHIQLAEHSLPPTPPPRCKSHIVSTSHKVKPWSQDWLIAAGAYPGFCSMKRLEVFLLPLDGILVHRRSLHRKWFPNNSPVSIYIPGWREALWEYRVLPKNKGQCPQPGLEPGPLAPESSALTMRPTCLSPFISLTFIFSSKIQLAALGRWFLISF